MTINISTRKRLLSLHRSCSPFAFPWNCVCTPERFKSYAQCFLCCWQFRFACIWAELTEKKEPNWLFSNTNSTEYSILFHSSQNCTSNDAALHSEPLKSGERASDRPSIDTNLCNERPKLLQKLPSKIQFSHFLFAFLCCRHYTVWKLVRMVFCEQAKCMSNGNGAQKKKKTSQKSNSAPTIEWEYARVLRGSEMNIVKEANEWTMSMSESKWDSNSNNKKYHCVAANRSTFDSIIISKITLVKSNFSIEKVHNSLVVLLFVDARSHLCVNTFVRQVVIQLAYFIRISHLFFWNRTGKEKREKDVFSH